MQYRKVGNSGLKVSAISYGTWGTRLWADEKQTEECILAALDLGITTFDTADVYGWKSSEEVLGNALKNRSRDSYELLTKVFWDNGTGPNNKGLSRKHIFDAVHGSLKRLNTDYIDIYQAHSFDNETPLEETIRAFEDLIKQGKIRYAGVSNWTADQLKLAIDIQSDLRFNKLISNQPQYSALNRSIEESIVPYCQSAGISQIVWSPLAMGILSGKYDPDQEYPTDSRAANEHGKHIMSFINKRMLRAVQELKPIASAVGATVSQLSYAWVLSNTNVASAITGAKTVDQLRENACSVDITLSPEVISKINEVLTDVQYG